MSLNRLVLTLAVAITLGCATAACLFGTLQEWVAPYTEHHWEGHP